MGQDPMTPMEAGLRRMQGRPKLEVHAHLSVTDTENLPPRILLDEAAFVSMLYLKRPRGARTEEICFGFGRR